MIMVFGWFLSRVCSDFDYMIYYSGQSSSERYKLYFNYFKKNESNNGLDFISKFYVYSSVNSQYYTYVPINDLSITYDDFLDYAILLNQHGNISDYYVHYNSACYNNFVNREGSIEFSDGSVIDLSQNDSVFYYSNYTDNALNGIDSAVGSSSSSNNEMNSNHNSSGSFNLSDIVSNVGDYANSFISSINSLVNISKIFLTGLPPEIYSMLLSFFGVGLIIILIKLFL